MGTRRHIGLMLAVMSLFLVAINTEGAGPAGDCRTPDCDGAHGLVRRVRRAEEAVRKMSDQQNYIDDEHLSNTTYSELPSDMETSYPGFTNEGHPEAFDIRAMPAQPEVKKPGQLPESEIKKFFEEGYLVIEKFFEETELDPIRETINKYVDNVAQKLFKAGKIKDLYEDYGYYHRLAKLEEAFPGANILCFKQMDVVPQALKDIWTNERLLNLIEQLLGPDIAGSPVWNLRTKTPQNEATTVPWHQDLSYLDNAVYNAMIPTAWVPFLDVDEKNGCLQFMARGHVTGKVANHEVCWGDTWYTLLTEEEMERTLDVNVKDQLRTVPLKYGGLVLFNNIIPHRSLNNLSDHVRWSVDLRWQRPTVPSGLWGLKDPVLMRTSKDPNYKIDWTEFDSVNRHTAQNEFTTGESDERKEELDTTVQGPWMKKWKLVHVNRHAERFLADEKRKK